MSKNNLKLRKDEQKLSKMKEKCSNLRKMSKHNLQLWENQQK